MSRRTLALVAGAMATALAVASVALIAMMPQVDLFEGWGFKGYDAAFALVYVAVGLLVTTRRPDNLIGWLFLASAVLSGVQTVADSYSNYAFAVGAPGGSELLWFAGWIWLPAISLIAVTLMLFPSGRPLSSRWRTVIVALIPVTVLVTILWAIAAPGEGRGTTADPDPLGLGPQHPLRIVAGLSILLLVAGLVAGAISLWARMRRGDTIERQQIKWILYAAALLGPALALSVLMTLVPTDPLVAKIPQLLAIAAVMLIPVAATVAILRYRLYDIDVLINRTLVYGALSAVLAATYLATVVLAQAALRPLTGGSELAVAVSTLATLAVVQPLRRRIQDAVDRRFYRSRYDAARTLDLFAARLRDDVELDRLRADVLDAVRETMQPAHASLWLRRS